jgi:hypothetical protein
LWLSDFNLNVRAVLLRELFGFSFRDNIEFWDGGNFVNFAGRILDLLLSGSFTS